MKISENQRKLSILRKVFSVKLMIINCQSVPRHFHKYNFETEKHFPHCARENGIQTENNKLFNLSSLLSKANLFMKHVRATELKWYVKD